MATDVDTVRLLIGDVDLSNRLFTDDQVQGFLDVEGGSVKRAAAQALDTMASSEVLVSKVIKSQDLSTDGAKVADALRRHAAVLRTQADVADSTGSSGLPVWSFPEADAPIDPHAIGWL